MNTEQLKKAINLLSTDLTYDNRAKACMILTDLLEEEETKPSSTDTKVTIPNNGSTLNVDFDGNIFWNNKRNQLHRVDGPAVEYTNGYKEWHINGRKIRSEWSI